MDLLEYERGFWARGVSRIAGIDEAGRGPLAGPVVAAAVVLPEGALIEGADDSKRLDPEVREELFARIVERATVGVGAASVREIDRYNILRATTRAMDRALRALRFEPEHVVVDGLPVRGVDWSHDAVVDGDALVHSIACASIVAKVVRDRLMRRLAPRYPKYGWERNMGYGTAEHRKAVQEFGLSPHHRRSFTDMQVEMDLGGPGEV